MAADNAFLSPLSAATSIDLREPEKPTTRQAKAGSVLPSAFSVSQLATASVANAALAARGLQADLGAPDLPVEVDQRLASLWFGFTLVPIGWEIAGAWDEIAGIYRTADGFIRLHTNAVHHRRAAVAALGCADDRPSVAAAVALRTGEELQEAIYARGGVAVALNSRQGWAAHPQGSALRTEPLVHRSFHPAPDPATPHRPADAGRPLAGVRVLDLTRVLAGPVATRFLAGLGADVLRIDPASWSEPGVVPEVTLGKRCAHLDLRSTPGRSILAGLLSTADIIVHGYRPGALDGLGFGARQRRDANPGIVDVSLNAWGHAGPWADRRGFDSIVQIASGIADASAAVYQSDEPRPLPVQALDHAAGYTLAACAINGWRHRRATDQGSTWKTSLAGHGELLCAGPPGDPHADFPALNEADLSDEIEDTPWGPARRARPPVKDLLSWHTGPQRLGSTATSAWLSPARDKN